MTVPEKIWASSQLPSLPAVAIRLLELSRKPETEISDVVEVVRADPAIAVKILKASNSSFFGFRSQITSIDRAVPLLGTTVVTSLALGFSLADASMTTGPMCEHYNSYWMQSIVQASTAELLCQRAGTGLDCEYFLAGLLTDIGRLAMLKTLRQDYIPVLQAASEGLKGLQDVEQKQLGYSHVEVGAKLVESWDLPEAFLLAVQLHHSPLTTFSEYQDGPHFDLVKAVATATCIGDYFCGPDKGNALERLKRFGAEFYSIKDADLQQFIDQVNERMEAAGELFSLNMSQIPGPSDLLAEANEQLAQLAMRAHVESTQAQERQKSVEEEKKKLETQNQELQEQVVHDPLTRIYNRRFFVETLQKEIGRARRGVTPVGVLFIDVDHFKRLNDTHGHQCGDLVLCRIAKTIAQTVRSCDTVARYGGEEFVVLASEPSEKGIGKLAERVRASVEVQDVVFDGKPIHATISVGAAIAIPQRRETDLASKLIATADEAMYDSKSHGRNQVHVRSLINETERHLIQKVTQHRFSRWLVDREIFDIPTISKVLSQCRPDPTPIGQLAQEFGYLKADEVARILDDQKESGERFGQIAIRVELLSAEELVHLLTQQKENSTLLKRALVHAGLLEQKRADMLLQEYCSERVPERCVATDSSD